MKEDKNKMVYKDKCGFKKIGCCNFKEDDCKPKAIDDTKQNSDLGLYCDLYNIEWNSKSVKIELDKLKKLLKQEIKGKLTLKKIKAIRKLEKENKMDNDVIEYKRHLIRIEDYGKGVEILRKGYRYLKRTRQ